MISRFFCILLLQEERFVYKRHQFLGNGLQHMRSLQYNEAKKFVLLKLAYENFINQTQTEKEDSARKNGYNSINPIFLLFSMKDYTMSCEAESISKLP